MSRAARGPQPRIAIVGSGVCGIALGVKLKQAGFTNFVIFEADVGIGGTWRLNTYPGAAVDVPSTVYQYSFNNHLWARTHGQQSELLDYLEKTARRFGLTRHIRLNTKVDSARWDDATHQYHLGIGGEVEDFDILVAATGFLNDPNMPTWPGLETFRGPMFHTSLWDHSVDLPGKKIAVVGVGSSSAQIVPAIQPVAEQVLVFQREPGWVLPKHARDYNAEELERHSHLWKRKLDRYKLMALIEWNLLFRQVYVPGSKRNLEAEQGARGYIDTVFKDRPDLREAVTPKYAFSGKRRVQSDDFYPALLEDNVRLVPHAVTSVTPTGLVDATGQEHEVDVLVIATGFKAWNYLSRLEVRGRDGREIHETWRDGAFALAGMTVPGYPNLYIMYGPNTNGAGLVAVNSLAEQQSKWIIRNLRRMRRRGYTAIDTRQRHAELYNSWLQRRLKKTAWAGANNYMKGPTGTIVTQFHGPVSLYWSLLQIVRLVSTYGTRRPTGVVGAPKPDPTHVEATPTAHEKESVA